MPTRYNAVSKVSNIEVHNFRLARLFHSLHFRRPSPWKSRGLCRHAPQLQHITDAYGHYANVNVSVAVFNKLQLPYSLDITPPSFISPPFHFARIRCEGIFISNLSPPDHGRTLRLRRTRGRLELTVPPYIECSYLLASDKPTKPLATRRQARS